MLQMIKICIFAVLRKHKIDVSYNFLGDSMVLDKRHAIMKCFPFSDISINTNIVVRSGRHY